MVNHRESFWSAVYPAFMTRDLTRADLRFIVRRGLARKRAGSYKVLVELLNMKPTDLQAFLNFLRKHECHVPFERFRSARLRPRTTADDDCVASDIVDRTDPVLADVIATADDMTATRLART